jgi:hypothetical protein
MNPFDPFNFINLSGDGTMRNVTLAVPTERVRDLLPNGLELGPQNLTPSGTHPIILGFHDMFRLHMSIPTLLPSMTYREHSIGIPFCYVTRGGVTGASPGPYYFMPILLLDNVLATLGGIMFWGYPKRLASFEVGNGRYTASRTQGEPLVTMSWTEGGEHRPVGEYEYFERQRQAISQPLIGLMPFSLGPFFAVADFPKKWDVATVRPLETITEVHTDYVPGFSAGRYPKRGTAPGIDVSVVGSYELRAPWLMSMPYPPLPR